MKKIKGKISEFTRCIRLDLISFCSMLTMCYVANSVIPEGTGVLGRAIVYLGAIVIGNAAAVVFEKRGEETEADRNEKIVNDASEV